MDRLAEYGQVQSLFTTGGIYDASNEDLKRYLCIVATQCIKNEWVRHNAIVMSNAINGILLERLLDEQERRNKSTQRYFLAVAILALLATIAQVVMVIF